MKSESDFILNFHPCQVLMSDSSRRVDKLTIELVEKTLTQRIHVDKDINAKIRMLISECQGE